MQTASSTFFYLVKFLKKLADDQCSSITKAVSTTLNIVHTTFYHGSVLTWNCTFNGSIYNVLYLQILGFDLVQQFEEFEGKIKLQNYLMLPWGSKILSQYHKSEENPLPRSFFEQIEAIIVHMRNILKFWHFMIVQFCVCVLFS